MSDRVEMIFTFSIPALQFELNVTADGNPSNIAGAIQEIRSIFNETVNVVLKEGEIEAALREIQPAVNEPSNQGKVASSHPSNPQGGVASSRPSSQGPRSQPEVKDDDHPQQE